jgi:hypothetical protein
MNDNLHQLEIYGFVALTTIVGLLALLRMTIIELFEITTTMVEYVLRFHHNIRYFRKRYKRDADTVSAVIRAAREESRHV